MNPLLMVWNLEEGAVKPFTNFNIQILQVLNFKEAAVKPFTQFSNDILIFLLQFDYISKLAGSDVCRHRGARWRPVAAARKLHRKHLQLRGFDLKVRFDGSIARCWRLV